jgi:hypothetical protein
LAEPKRNSFVNEAEEAAWWEANEEAVTCAFEKAMNDGYVGACDVVITGDSTVTKIRMGSKDFVKARVQAAKCDLRFHLYLKALIQDSLRKPETERG